MPRAVDSVVTYLHASLRVATLDGLPTDRNDPLDEVLLVRRHEADELPEPPDAFDERIRRRFRGRLLVPVGGRTEYHDVAGMRIAYIEDQLVHQVPVPGAAWTAVQRLL